MKKYQILKWVVVGSLSLVGFNAQVVSAQEQSSSTREVLNEKSKTEKTIESSDTKAFSDTLKLPKEANEDSIELMLEKTEIEVGQTLQMNAVIIPENSLDKVVTWTSSDNSLATVSKEGLVTAIKAGSVSITVKTQNGKTANRLLTIQGKTKTKTADGVFGTVPWTWEEETGTVIFGGGEFPETGFNVNICKAIESSDRLQNGKIHHIKFTETVEANSNSSYLFADLSDLKTIENSTFLNTVNVKNMNNMFYKTMKLTKLDVSQWDTSNVNNMFYMFSYTKELIKLDVSDWDTSNVTVMGGMFFNANSLTRLDVSKWDTSNVTYMRDMFFNANNLSELDVSKWNTSNVADMGGMFSNTDSLTELDVSKWNTSNVTNMGRMFCGAKSLNELDVSQWDTSSVWYMQRMFSDVNIIKLDVSKWNTGEVTNMGDMFYGAVSLSELDVSRWDTSKVTHMGNMFRDLSSVTKLDVSQWDISNVWFIEGMFSSTKSLTELDLSQWDMRSVDDTYGLFMPYLFSNSSVDTLILGENVRLFYNCDLPEKNSKSYTGRWILVSDDEENSYESSSALVKNYDGSKPGKYVREKYEDKINIVGIELTPKIMDITVEEEVALQTKITPDNATNKNLTYITSDASIATVSNIGVVKGIKAGTATITATTEDGGFQATSTINVSQNSKMLIDLFYLGIDEYVTGEVETDLGAKKVQLIVNGEVIGTTNVYRDGSFELDTQGMITKPTDKVEVVALDRKNQELERMSVIIEEKSYSLLTNPFILFEDTKVTGQTDYFHTHVALVIEGEEIERKILPANRQYSFEAEALIEYEDDQVEIVGYRYDSEITRKEVTIQTPVIEMDIESYAVGQTFITGKVTGKSAKNVRLYVNRRRQQTVKIAEDGTFSLLGISILSPKDKVEVAVLNGQGIEVLRVKVTVTN